MGCYNMGGYAEKEGQEMSNLDSVGRLKYLQSNVWPYWFMFAWHGRGTLWQVASEGAKEG